MPFTSPFEDTLHVGGSAYRHASLALLADRHPPLRRLPKVRKSLAEITAPVLSLDDLVSMGDEGQKVSWLDTRQLW